MAKRRRQRAAGGDADEDGVVMLAAVERIFDIVEMDRVEMLGRQAIVYRHQVVAAGGAQLGADIVVRIEAAEDETATVNEQDQGAVVTAAVAVMAKRNIAMAAGDAAVASGYAWGMGIVKLSHHRFVVDTLLCYAGGGRQS
jgi:hypothetical protein